MIKVEKKITYVCEICNDVFENMNEAQEHAKLHEKDNERFETYEPYKVYVLKCKHRSNPYYNFVVPYKITNTPYNTVKKGKEINLWSIFSNDFFNISSWGDWELIEIISIEDAYDKYDIVFDQPFFTAKTTENLNKELENVRSKALADNINLLESVNATKIKVKKFSFTSFDKEKYLKEFLKEVKLVKDES